MADIDRDVNVGYVKVSGQDGVREKFEFEYISITTIASQSGLLDSTSGHRSSEPDSIPPRINYPFLFIPVTRLYKLKKYCSCVLLVDAW